MWFFLLACVADFPCADDEVLDKDGEGLSAGGGDSGDSGGAPADDGWPARFVAPYVDATAYPTVTLGSIGAENGLKRYTLGFVVAASAGDCDATWGSYYDLATGPSAWGSSGEHFLYDEIATLRASEAMSWSASAARPARPSRPHAARWRRWWPSMSG